MPEIVASGPRSDQTWRRTLSPDQTVTIGRLPQSGWSVPWDESVSRDHAELSLHNTSVHVRKVTSAKNPIFFKGEPAEEFNLLNGESFVIGSTSFRLVVNSTTPSSLPHELEQVTFRPGDLQAIQFSNADQRLEILAKVPDIIGRSVNDDEFNVRLVGLLLAGIPHSEAVALVRKGSTAKKPVEIMQWDRRRDAGGQFRPSQRLVSDVFDRNESVLHIWKETESDPEFTMIENMDWAFCTPVPGEACKDWALYVAGDLVGHGGEERVEWLKSDLRFAELFAELIGALSQVKDLERHQAKLTQFFSPTVLEAISGNLESGLEPRETEVTVLFCDLRGFSREAEHWRDNLAGLLDRVSDALGVMTNHILKNGGVIGDVQGDAAMGFWGWPLPGPDGPLHACRAALEILSNFMEESSREGNVLRDFQVGIGVAHGRAVAGKIGTSDQVKVTVFGPVVNLASRLESMTKQLRVPVLLDEVTAAYVRDKMSSDEARCRRLGRILPYGMDTPVMVHELVPPTDQSILTNDHLKDYETAVDALIAGKWSESLELLHKLPPKDRARDFLTIYVAQHGYEPPPNWNGTISLSSK